MAENCLMEDFIHEEQDFPWGWIKYLLTYTDTGLLSSRKGNSVLSDVINRYLNIVLALCLP